MKAKNGHRPPLSAEKIAEIRRLVLDNRLSQRAIGRKVGVSYTTVKKYSGQRLMEQPKY